MAEVFWSLTYFSVTCVILNESEPYSEYIQSYRVTVTYWTFFSFGFRCVFSVTTIGNMAFSIFGNVGWFCFFWLYVTFFDEFASIERRKKLISLGIALFRSPNSHSHSFCRSLTAIFCAPYVAMIITRVTIPICYFTFFMNYIAQTFNMILSW